MINNSAPLYAFSCLIHQYNILFSTNHITQSSSRSVKTVSVQYCTHIQLQTPQITKPGATDFVSSIYRHCPTYVRAALHGTLHKSEFPYIQFNFLLSHVQEKLQKCGSKLKKIKGSASTIQNIIQYN